jgi:hypothetical protein
MLGSSVQTYEWNKDKADICPTVQFGAMLDNFIFRTLFCYFSFQLDREKFKGRFKKERISLYCFHDLRHCHYLNLIANKRKKMPELFIPFLTALDNCLFYFSESLKFTFDCVGICRLLCALCGCFGNMYTVL